MLKTGDVVWQDHTMVNNKNYYDNKERRLSVVLFTTEIDNKEYACTVPITNTVKSSDKYPNKYYHMPYLLLDNIKLSCVKLNSINLYNTDIMHYTSLTIGDDHIDRIFDKIKEMPHSRDEDYFFEFVYDNIDKVYENKNKEDKERKHQSKMLRKQKRRDMKRGISAS